MRSITTPGIGSGSSWRMLPSPCRRVGSESFGVEPARPPAARRSAPRSAPAARSPPCRARRASGWRRPTRGGPRWRAACRPAWPSAAGSGRAPRAAAGRCRPRRRRQRVVHGRQDSHLPMHWQRCWYTGRRRPIAVRRVEVARWSSRATAALVTGASRGLGAALAAELARRGRARGARGARGGRRCERSWPRSAPSGGEAHALAADVGDKEAVYPLAGAAAALVGPDRPARATTRARSGRCRCAARSTPSARTSRACSR